MKKRIAMLVMGVLLLGGCGAKEPTQMPVDQNVAPTVEATPTPTPEPTATPTPTPADQGEVEVEHTESSTEMTGANIQTSVEESAEAVESLEAGFGYKDLLEGTQIGMSGTNCYVMIDGEGLLYDFDGYVLPTVERKNDHIVGASAIFELANVDFRGYCGETDITRNNAKHIGSEEVGEKTVDFYWNEKYGILEGYCKALDCGVYMSISNPGEGDQEKICEALKEEMLSRLSYFNANEGAE